MRGLFIRRERMGRFDGRVAFVTGSGRGIGAATALRLAEEGAPVALVDLDTSGCERVAAEIRALGSQALVFECNVADAPMLHDPLATPFPHFATPHTPVNTAPATRD